MFGFIIRADAELLLLEFSEEDKNADKLEYKCFLQGGEQRCRGCYHESLCDDQDSYEYENGSFENAVM